MLGSQAPVLIFEPRVNLGRKILQLFFAELRDGFVCYVNRPGFRGGRLV
jgi:hypothetical protein